MTSRPNRNAVHHDFKLLDTDNTAGIPAGWLSMLRRFADGKSYEDIAIEFDVPTGTVKSRIFRTRSRIVAQRALAIAAAARVSKLLFTNVRVGDKLRADDGFTCIEAGRVCVVKTDAQGELYVDCCGHQIDLRSGGFDATKLDYSHRHGLDGQEDEDGTLVGFEKVEA